MSRPAREPVTKGCKLTEQVMSATMFSREFLEACQPFSASSGASSNCTVRHSKKKRQRLPDLAAQEVLHMNQQSNSVGHPSQAMQDETAGAYNGTQATQTGSQYPSGGNTASVTTASSSAAQSREVQHG